MSSYEEASTRSDHEASEDSYDEGSYDGVKDLKQPRQRSHRKPIGRQHWSIHQGRSEETLPPPNVILDDWWILKVMQSSLTGDQRHTKYPVNFLIKGLIDYRIQGIGRAAKIWSVANHRYEYAIIRGIELHGEEGAHFLRTYGKRSAAENKSVTSIREAVIQNDQEGTYSETTTRIRIADAIAH